MKKSHIRIALLLTLFLIFVFVFSPILAFAQGFEAGRGLAISPFLLERKMEKGQTLDEIIEITNTSNTRLPVSISIHDFIPEGDNGEVRYLEAGEGDRRVSLTSWVKILSNPKPQLDPKERTEMRFTITPPADAEEGGHYGAILFSLEPEQAEGSAVAVQQKLGAIILVKLGRVNEAGSIVKFSAIQTFWEYPPVTLKTRFKNEGNVQVKPRGSISITNMFGRRVASVLVNENASNVLAGTEREFESKWKDRFGFGRYSAEVKLVYGDNGQVVSAKSSFWVIPWKVTVAVAAGLTLAIIIFTLLLRRYNRWVLARAYGADRRYPPRRRG